MGKKSRKLRSPKYAKKYAIVRGVVASIKERISTLLSKEDKLVEEIKEPVEVEKVVKKTTTREETTKPKVETKKKPTTRSQRTRKKAKTTKSEE